MAKSYKSLAHVVGYEYSTFMDAARIVLHGITVRGSVLHNTVVESFGIHARNLIEFFYWPKKRKDDLRVAAFYDTGESPWNGKKTPPFLHTTHKRVSKLVGHITTTRAGIKPKAKSWDIPRIVRALHKPLREFAQSAPRQRLPSGLRAVLLSDTDYLGRKKREKKA